MYLEKVKAKLGNLDYTRLLNSRDFFHVKQGLIIKTYIFYKF